MLILKFLSAAQSLFDYALDVSVLFRVPAPRRAPRMQMLCGKWKS